MSLSRTTGRVPLPPPFLPLLIFLSLFRTLCFTMSLSLSLFLSVTLCHEQQDVSLLHSVLTRSCAVGLFSSALPAAHPLHADQVGYNTRYALSLPVIRTFNPTRRPPPARRPGTQSLRNVFTCYTHL